jgi:hypothetical protein
MFVVIAVTGSSGVADRIIKGRVSGGAVKKREVVRKTVHIDDAND